MRKSLFTLIVILLFIVPNLLLTLYKEPTETQELLFTTTESVTESNKVRNRVVRLKDGNEILEIDFDEYILGVLLGEIPADFEDEALKAQAVATRTYTLRSITTKAKHEDADLCTISQCCQAYKSVVEYISNIGSMAYVDKMRSAVERTHGQVLTYDDKLIEATYFSCSGGRTEDAVDVWGSDIPYLRSVSSPGEETSRHYSTQTIMTKEAFFEKLGLPLNTVLAQDQIMANYTEGGGIDTIQIGNRIFSGVELRSLLSLPSTFATFTVSTDNVIITTKGNGHRVGLSQYGADAMALSGRSYSEILNHYYPGAKLVTLTEEQINAVFDKAGNL